MKTLWAACLAMLVAVAALADTARDLVADPALEVRVNRLAAELRCLVCQNQSLADSHAPLAIDLKNQVREQLKAGRSDRDVIDYMTQRYGDFVLYKPPFKANTVILWLGPVALFLVGLAAFYLNLRRRKSAVAKTVRPLTAEEKARADKLLSGDKE